MRDDWATRPERSTLGVMRLYAWLSRSAGRRVGRWILPAICLYFLLFARAARSASQQYLHRVLARPPGWRDLYRHFHSFASVVHDRLFLLGGELQHFTIDIEGEAQLRAALAQGRGLILLGAHFGSFEILRAGLVTRCDLPKLNVLMYIDNASNSNRIFAAANRLGVEVIALGRPDALLRAMECLQRGEMVGMLGDRTLGQDKIVHVPFLGELAAFPQAPWLLASLAQAPVALFFGCHENAHAYTIRFEAFADRIDIPRSERAALSTVHATRFAERLQAQCLRSPYNWFNFYAFWKPAA
jgi:predicted LPLAT superfamily acyltransferase